MALCVFSPEPDPVSVRGQRPPGPAPSGLATWQAGALTFPRLRTQAQVVAFAGKGRPSKDDAKGDGVTGKDTSKPKDWDTERKKAAKFADSDDGLADQKRYDW